MIQAFDTVLKLKYCQNNVQFVFIENLTSLCNKPTYTKLTFTIV
jgi:hypothetical protein